MKKKKKEEKKNRRKRREKYKGINKMGITIKQENEEHKEWKPIYSKKKKKRKEKKR